MQRNEIVEQLMQQAENLGLRFEFDCGLVRVTRSAEGDRKRQNAAIDQLGKCTSGVRALTQARAIGARAADFIGQRIVSKEHGAGTLIGTSGDGCLMISVSKEMRKSNEEEIQSSQITLTCNAEYLLIVVDEEKTAGAAGPTVPTPEPKPGFFDRLRRG